MKGLHRFWLVAFAALALASFGSLRTMHMAVAHASPDSTQLSSNDSGHEHAPPSAPDVPDTDEECPECFLPTARAGVTLATTAFAVESLPIAILPAAISAAPRSIDRAPTLSRGPPA